MQKTIVTLGNKIVGHLTLNEKSDLEFMYEDGYVRSSSSCPLSLSMPLSFGPFPSKITRPFFQHILGEIDVCFQSNVASRVGCVSTGEPLKSGTSKNNSSLYGLLSLEDLKLECGEVPSHPVVSLQDLQPTAQIALIDAEFYKPSHELLITHCIKGELSTPEEREKAPDLVTNEIFMTMIAYNLGIPVPTIHRFQLNEDPDSFAIVMDRPDRSAPSLPYHLPEFYPAETLETALMGFRGEGGVAERKGRLKAVGNDEPDRLEVSLVFQLLHQHSLKPALDFRILLRTIVLCLLSGCDDFNLGDQWISLKSVGEDNPEDSGCRILQMRNFLCTDIYDRGRKKLLTDLFNVHNVHQITVANLDDFARKTRINAKYLKSMLLDQALVIPKIAREILQDYPSLQSSVTAKIVQLMENRALLFNDLLNPQETRGEMVSRLI